MVSSNDCMQNIVAEFEIVSSVELFTFMDHMYDTKNFFILFVFRWKTTFHIKSRKMQFQPAKEVHVLKPTIHLIN